MTEKVEDRSKKAVEVAEKKEVKIKKKVVKTGGHITGDPVSLGW